MNIALVYFGKNDILSKSRKIIAKKLYDKGHILKEINGVTDSDKVLGMQYAIFFVDGGGMFRQNVMSSLEKFLRNNENLCTKYISIYINHKFRPVKTLCRYMACLERYGVIIHDSAVIKTEEQMTEIAGRLEPVIAQ